MRGRRRRITSIAPSRWCLARLITDSPHQPYVPPNYPLERTRSILTIRNLLRIRHIDAVLQFVLKWKTSDWLARYGSQVKEWRSVIYYDWACCKWCMISRRVVSRQDRVRRIERCFLGRRRNPQTQAARRAEQEAERKEYERRFDAVRAEALAEVRAQAKHRGQQSKQRYLLIGDHSRSCLNKRGGSTIL